MADETGVRETQDSSVIYRQAGEARAAGYAVVVIEPALVERARGPGLFVAEAIREHLEQVMLVAAERELRRLIGEPVEVG